MCEILWGENVSSEFLIHALTSPCSYGILSLCNALFVRWISKFYRVALWHLNEIRGTFDGVNKNRSICEQYSAERSLSLSLAVEVYSAMECILGKMRVKLITNWVLGIVHATIYVYVSEREGVRDLLVNKQYYRDSNAIVFVFCKCWWNADCSNIHPALMQYSQYPVEI